MSSSFNAMVVEDEPFARADLIFMLCAHPCISVQAEAGTVKEAKAALAKRHYDVIFLDVQLRGGSGFDILDEVPTDTVIIFLTSYEEYAVRAFEINALDYLVKPVTSERLARAVDRLLEHHTAIAAGESSSAQVKDGNNVVIVQSNDAQLVMPVEHIVAVVSLGGNYTTVQTIGKQSYTVRRTFRYWESVLPMTRFLRVHRQSLANMTCASALRKTDNGVWELELNDMPTPLNVSRRALPAIRRFFKTHAESLNR